MKEKKKKRAQHSRSDQSVEVVRVHKILGQLEGVERMIDSHRPWPQVLQQVQAAIAGLTSLKMEILKRYLNECVSDSAQKNNYAGVIAQMLEVVRIQLRK